MKLSAFIVSGGIILSDGSYLHIDCPHDKVYSMVIEKDCLITADMTPSMQREIAWKVYSRDLEGQFDE